VALKRAGCCMRGCQKNRLLENGPVHGQRCRRWSKWPPSAWTVCKSRCVVYWICLQRSTASIISFCCSDFDETLDLPRQCLRGRRRLSPAELSKCYIQGLPFRCLTCPVWGPTGICPWPHTVCLVYGRNRPNRCSAHGSSSISMPTTAKFTSPRQWVKFTCAIDQLSRCLHDVDVWMSASRLRLNARLPA